MNEITIRFETVEEFKNRTKKEFKELEEGKIEEPKHNISIDPTNLPKAFTQKRLELLLTVSQEQMESIKQLAEKLERDYKSVYQDVQYLNKAGLLKLEKEGKAKSPVKITMPYKKVIFDFENKAKT